MKCLRKIQVMEYLDGEMRPTQAERFEKHLRECSRCRSLLQEYRALYRELETSPAIPPVPVGFTAQVVSALPEIDRRGQTLRVRTIGAIALAALFFGFGLVFFGQTLDYGFFVGTVQTLASLAGGLLGNAVTLVEAALVLTVSLWENGAVIADLILRHPTVLIPALAAAIGLELLLIRRVKLNNREGISNE